MDVDPLIAHLLGSSEERARLHLRNLGIDDAEPAAAEAEHRIGLAQTLNLALQKRVIHTHLRSQRPNLLVLMR